MTSYIPATSWRYLDKTVTAKPAVLQQLDVFYVPFNLSAAYHVFISLFSPFYVYINLTFNLSL